MADDVSKWCISKLCNEEQLQNIKEKSLTCEVSKLDISIVFKEVQSLNAAPILTTFLVLKLLKSKEIKEWQEVNIKFISFKEDVFALPKFTFSKEIHLKQNPSIDSTNEKSNFDKSIDIILNIASNIFAQVYNLSFHIKFIVLSFPSIFVTFPPSL